MYIFTKILLNEIFKCKYHFNCRLEYKKRVLRKIFGSNMETLTGAGENSNEIWEMRFVLQVRLFGHIKSTKGSV